MAWSLDTLIQETTRTKRQNGQAARGKQRNLRGIDRWQRLLQGDCSCSSETRKGCCSCCAAQCEGRQSRETSDLSNFCWCQRGTLRFRKQTRMRKIKRKHVGTTLPKKGFVGSFHYGLVRKPVSDQDAMKIPEARGRRGLIMETLKNIFAWDVQKLRSKSAVVSQAKKDGKTVHFANLMDLSVTWRMPNLQNTFRNTRDELCSGETTMKTKKDTEQYSQSKTLQLRRWQQQSYWTLSQSFLVWLEKHVTQFQRTLRSKWPKLPDCYDCQKKNVLKIGSGFLHDRETKKMDYCWWSCAAGWMDLRWWLFSRPSLGKTIWRSDIWKKWDKC